MASIAPSFVELYYVDDLSPHTMRLNTRQWIGTGIGNPGEYLAWDASTAPADIMIENMITAILPNMLPATTFVSYSIFDVPDFNLPPNEVFSAFVSGQVGTLVNTGNKKAVSYTMSFKTVAFNLAKIVMLNTPVGGFFGNVVGLSARDTDIASEFLLASNAWSGADAAQISTFSNITVSLNKRLRRKYNMI